MIPDNKDFSEFLKTISLKDPRNNEYEKVSVSLLPAGGKTEEYDEGLVAHDKIQFWSKPGDKISLESVVRKLTEELQKKGHVASAEICLAVLSIYALHPDKEKKPIELINGLIEKIGPCNLTQYCVTSLPYTREWNYEMPPFHIGTLDMEKLKFACSKIPSDFYERYKNDLTSAAFSIQRNISRVKLISSTKFVDEILYDYISHSPYMTTSAFIKKEWREKLHAVNHVDNSTRPQILHKENNPFLYELIENVYSKTGIPVLLNTSFNKQEPIVETPFDAINTFKKFNINYLVLNDYIISK